MKLKISLQITFLAKKDFKWSRLSNISSRIKKLPEKKNNGFENTPNEPFPFYDFSGTNNKYFDNSSESNIRNKKRIDNTSYIISNISAFFRSSEFREWVSLSNTNKISSISLAVDDNKSNSQTKPETLTETIAKTPPVQSCRINKL